MAKRKVVIITDCYDVAYMELRQTVANELDMRGIEAEIEPVVPVFNFSVCSAAFNIRLLAELYPAGTVFLVVVHGVKNNPIRIFGETENGILFIGNNSGYFNWMIQDKGLKSLYKNKLTRDKNWTSFGGKYIQAPMVAKLIESKNWDELGDLTDATTLADYIIPEGTVVHVDNFGLMKIFAPKLDIPDKTPVEIYINGEKRLEAIYVDHMKVCEDGTWTLYPGSSLYFLPELGRVRSLNSAGELGVKPGDVISWKSK